MNDPVYPDPALLAAVRAALPDDKLPRLVLADWLDENGDPDRAEFIRRQCGFFGCPTIGNTERQTELLRKNGHLWFPQLARPLETSVYHRVAVDYYDALLNEFHFGLIEEITVGTVAAWIGEETECLACEDAPACPETNVVECSRCDGTGVDFIKGIGGLMVRMHPLGRVRIRTLQPVQGENGGWYWDCVAGGGGGSGLPTGVYERLPVFSEIRRFNRRFPMRIGYESEDSADAEVSEALILYAKEEL